MDKLSLLAITADIAVFCIGVYLFFHQRRPGGFWVMMAALFLGAIIYNSMQ